MQHHRSGSSGPLHFHGYLLEYCRSFLEKWHFQLTNLHCSWFLALSRTSQQVIDHILGRVARSQLAGQETPNIRNIITTSDNWQFVLPLMALSEAYSRHQSKR